MRIKLSVLILAATSALLFIANAPSSAFPGFSNRNIKGTYAGTFEGVVLKSGTPVQIAGVGIYTADGKGRFTGQESFVVDGNPCEDVAVTGTYAVNPDGSGSTVLTFTSATPGCSGSVPQRLAIGDSSKVVVFVNIGSGQEVTETWRQQGLPL